MMSRRFTTREKILLLICAGILMAVLYYKVIYTPTVEAVEVFNTEELESDLLLAQVKAQKMDSMKAEIEGGTLKESGVVPTYNNLQNEINELNHILASADTYELAFSEATLIGDTVRRDISVSFHTGDYDSMKSVLENLYKCKYRCLIRSLQITTSSAQGTGIKTGGNLNVSLTVTFYETTVNAESTAGLKLEENTETPVEE